MKIALYIEDGREQIVLTPETATEKSILEKVADDDTRIVSIYRGGFYRCQGGWTRQNSGSDRDSTILVLDGKEKSDG